MVGAAGTVRPKLKTGQPKRVKQQVSRLLKKYTNRFRRRFVRHQTADRHQRLKHRVWLLGLAGFVTSVTIASIPSRETETISRLKEALATPPQVFDIAPVSRLGEMNETPARVTLGRDVDDDVENAPLRLDWTEITVRRGETLSQILQRANLDEPALLQFIRSHPEARPFHQIKVGQVLRLRADAQGRLQELATDQGEEATLHLRRTDAGFRVELQPRPFESQLTHVSGTIDSSLFEDGLAAGLSESVILRLVEIFGWDIDFAQQIRPGDGFAVIYEEKTWHGQKIADGPILAAEFINQGRTYRAVGFRDARGRMEYYSPEGLSLRRAFLRTPVELSRISSRFAMRFHPVLKTWRAHTGVDYAAPTGTPVRATAAGRIAAQGWNGGYGKAITIRHGGAYSTVYGHLSRFHPALRVGSLVEQGQVIGYVGATGLATGPHLHYELQVNGRHQNPLTFKFPGAAPIPAEHRQAFLQTASALGTRLDLISRGALALNTAAR